MKKVILVLCIFSFSILFANEGEELHKESCVACHNLAHDKKFYTTRVNKKMKTLAMLNSQVKKCSGARNAGWFPEEEASVAKWLNDTYYHLKK